MEESGTVTQDGVEIAIQRVNVDVTSATATLLRTPASGKRVRVFACALIGVGADNTFYFRSGASTDVFCSSSNPYPLSLLSGVGYPALLLNRNQDGWFEGEVDEALYLVTTTSGPVEGSVLLGDAPGS